MRSRLLDLEPEPRRPILHRDLGAAPAAARAPSPNPPKSLLTAGLRATNPEAPVSPTPGTDGRPLPPHLRGPAPGLRRRAPRSRTMRPPTGPQRIPRCRPEPTPRKNLLLRLCLGPFPTGPLGELLLGRNLLPRLGSPVRGPRGSPNSRPDLGKPATGRLLLARGSLIKGPAVPGPHRIRVPRASLLRKLLRPETFLIASGQGRPPLGRPVPAPAGARPPRRVSVRAPDGPRLADAFPPTGPAPPPPSLPGFLAAEYPSPRQVFGAARPSPSPPSPEQYPPAV